MSESLERFPKVGSLVPTFSVQLMLLELAIAEVYWAEPVDV